MSISYKAIIDVRESWGVDIPPDPLRARVPRCYDEVHVCLFCSQFFKDSESYRPVVHKDYDRICWKRFRLSSTSWTLRTRRHSFDELRRRRMPTSMHRIYQDDLNESRLGTSSVPREIQSAFFIPYQSARGLLLKYESPYCKYLSSKKY